MKLLHSRENEEKKFSRRLFLMGSAQAVLSLGLLGRLSYLGLMQDRKYHLLSENNSTKIHFILPQRGLIVDCTNQLIATSKYSYHLYITVEKCHDLIATLLRIQELLGLEDKWYHSTLSKLKGHPKYIPFSIFSELTWEQLCKIEVNYQFLSGCKIERNWTRYYPFDKLFAHTIGYVQLPKGQERISLNILKTSGYQLGKMGLEKIFEKKLQGIVGYNKIEVDAHNRTIQNIAQIAPKNGQIFKTSLSLDLQNFTAERLQQYESAAAVIIEIKSGQVLSLYSHPSYDPNLFVNGISQKDWTSLRENPSTPLHNRVLHGCYPPGSIFKSIVGLAALESGLVGADFSIDCRGYIEIGGHRFHCWHRHGHGHVSLKTALKQSCDIYFYEVAKIIGMQRIVDCAQKFGVGSSTNIEIGDNAGLLPTRAWKYLKRNQTWLHGDTVQLAIGQGDLLMTPLQLAVLTGSLVNVEKQFVKPTLIYNHQQTFEKYHFKNEHLAVIKKGLDETVNTPEGLAYNSRIMHQGFEMGGKTSTVQVKRITMAERKMGVITNEQRLWKNRDHALFAGYAPIDHPQYAVAVIIEHGGSGGKVAAPVGHDLLLKTQQWAEKKV